MAPNRHRRVETKLDIELSLPLATVIESRCVLETGFDDSGWGFEMTVDLGPKNGGLLGALTAEAARDLTDQIRVGLEGVFQLIKAAYRGRAWVSLGYASWDEYVTREFGNLHLRPPREDRQEVVRSFREIGMSIRAISTATQLGSGTVRRAIGPAGVPNGTPGVSVKVQGQDGKSYAASRPKRLIEPISEDASAVQAVTKSELGSPSVDDVLDFPASTAGVEPLDLAERAGKGHERVLRMLREFHGSGSAALPMTIKLASQVSGLVSPLTGNSEVSGQRLHELAFDVSRGVRTLSHVAVTLRDSAMAGDSEAAIKANLRDSVDELDRVLRRMEGSR